MIPARHRCAKCQPGAGIRARSVERGKARHQRRTARLDQRIAQRDQRGGCGVALVARQLAGHATDGLDADRARGDTVHADVIAGTFERMAEHVEAGGGIADAGGAKAVATDAMSVRQQRRQPRFEQRATPALQSRRPLPGFQIRLQRTP